MPAVVSLNILGRNQSPSIIFSWQEVVTPNSLPILQMSVAILKENTSKFRQ